MSRSVWARAATSAEADGWLVVPARDAEATSTASTPASTAASKRGELPAGGVVGVQVDGEVEPFPERRDELRGGCRTQEAGHVLDGEDVGAGVDDLLSPAPGSSPACTASRPGPACRRVAECDFGDGRSGGADGTDGRSHLVDVVQGVEDAEDVDAGGGRLVHEGLRHFFRVRRVAHGVPAAEQHLQADVRHGLPQGSQAVPRVLAQEAKGDVVGGAAPGLDGEQPGQQRGHGRSGGHQVAGADAGGQQRLVGVAERGVRDGYGRLLTQGTGEPFRTQFLQPLARARLRFAPLH